MIAKLQIEIEERRRVEETLQTNQFELEANNNELRGIQVQLKKLMQKYMDLYDFSPVGYCTVDLDGRIQEANLTASSLLGIEQSYLIKTHLYQYVAESHRDRLFLHLSQLKSTQTRQTCELRLIHADGSPYWAQLNSTIGDKNHYRITISDIHERKQAEEALRESEEKYRNLVDNTPDFIYSFDRESRHTSVNRSLCEALSLREKNIIGKNHKDLGFPDEIVSTWRITLKQVIDSGELLNIETTTPMPDGSVRTFEVVLTPIFNKEKIVTGIRGISRDITERRQAEDQLKALLEEKKVLLRELYHRTKNSMQVIRSMLLLQAGMTPMNIEVQKLVKDTESRIMAMALVHQKLYQSQDLSRIDARDYFNELSLHILQSYAGSSRRIALKQDLEPISMLLDTAIPCGLILNELLTNALKYAFPGDRPGEISIRLFRNPSGKLELQVADNGVGVPEGFDIRRQKTLGFSTIIGIAEHQMQGKLFFVGDNGVTCHIEFPDSLYTERV